MNEHSPPRSDAPTWLVYKGRLYGIRGEPASSLADGSWVERLPSLDEQAIERAVDALMADSGLPRFGPHRVAVERRFRLGLAAALEQPDAP